MISSYAEIHAIGHKRIADLLKRPVIVEEKIDGSQSSFGILGGELLARSKGKHLTLDSPEALFAPLCVTVKALADRLHPGWIYRGETLARPRHNALAYDRVPAGNVILFDINPGLEHYLSPEEKRAEAERLGLECVPVLKRGVIADVAEFEALLETPSVLGGQRIEGVVVKPEAYDLFGADGKCLMGKYVSEKYKEVQRGAWRQDNPTPGDIVQRIVRGLKTEARWIKAVQHLREAGTLEGAPQDIGRLMKEVHADIEKEEADEIKDALYRFALPHIKRACVSGLPEWYKGELLKGAF